MPDVIKLDMGDTSERPSIHKALENLGRLTIKMQEQDAMMQRMAQLLVMPDNNLRIDTDAICSSVVGQVVDPVIPKGYFEKTQEYQQKSLEILQSINENTANLYTIVELINQSNESQDEIIALMTEILSLAKMKNKAEVDSLFKQIMGKVNNTAGSVDSLIKLMGWATAVYNMVCPMLE